MATACSQGLAATMDIHIVRIYLRDKKQSVIAGIVEVVGTQGHEPFKTQDEVVRYPRLMAGRYGLSKPSVLKCSNIQNLVYPSTGAQKFGAPVFFIPDNIPSLDPFIEL